jgi:hypothetical protein
MIQESAMVLQGFDTLAASAATHILTHILRARRARRAHALGRVDRLTGRNLASQQAGSRKSMGSRITGSMDGGFSCINVWSPHRVCPATGPPHRGVKSSRLHSGWRRLWLKCLAWTFGWGKMRATIERAKRYSAANMLRPVGTRSSWYSTSSRLRLPCRHSRPRQLHFLVHPTASSFIRSFFLLSFPAMPPK